MSEVKKEMRDQMRAYAAFQMATALLVAANQQSNLLAPIVLSLFAISIPSTIAYSGLARITEDDKKKNPNPIAAASFVFAFVPSIAALSLIIWPASHLAAVTFPLASIIWAIAVVRLRRKQL